MQGIVAYGMANVSREKIAIGSRTRNKKVLLWISYEESIPCQYSKLIARHS
jgi:hypothetical protein